MGSVKNYAQISLQTWWINPAGKGDIVHYPSISAKKHEDGGKLPLTIQFSTISVAEQGFDSPMLHIRGSVDSQRFRAFCLWGIEAEMQFQEVLYCPQYIEIDNGKAIGFAYGYVLNEPDGQKVYYYQFDYFMIHGTGEDQREDLAYEIIINAYTKEIEYCSAASLGEGNG